MRIKIHYAQLVSSLTRFSEFIDHEMSRTIAHRPLIILNLGSLCAIALEIVISVGCMRKLIKFN